MMNKEAYNKQIIVACIGMYSMEGWYDCTKLSIITLKIELLDPFYLVKSSVLSSITFQFELVGCLPFVHSWM